VEENGCIVVGRSFLKEVAKPQETSAAQLVTWPTFKGHFPEYMLTWLVI